MNAGDVLELIRQNCEDLEGDLTEDERFRLHRMLTPPEEVSVIFRTVAAEDQVLRLWLVGREPGEDGYRLVLRDDGMFGLAGTGFPTDEYLILVGFYGDLVFTFKNM